MLLFLLVLYFFSFAATCLGLALVAKVRFRLAIVLVIGVVAILSTQYASTISARDFSQGIRNYATLANICLVQIVESVLGILVCFRFIRSQFERGKPSRLDSMCTLPSIVFVLGNTAALIGLLHSFSGVQFSTVSLIFAGSMCLVVGGVASLLRGVLREPASIVELKVFTLFLQVVLAMLIPLLAVGVEVETGALRVEPRIIVPVLAGMAGVSGIGFMLRLFVPPERVNGIWRSLIKVCT